MREQDFGKRFANCETGAIPAVGNLFGLDTLVDQSLSEQPDIYVESGRHDELVHMSGTQYMALMPDAKSGRFSE
ncbi:YbaK / prolyl-tRNA synthetases associated domain protein [compost metagenome]